MTLKNLTDAQDAAYKKYQETAEWLANEYARQSEYQVGDIIIDTKNQCRKNIFNENYKFPKELIFGGYVIHWSNGYRIKECILKLKEEDDKPFSEGTGTIVSVELLGKDYIKKKP